MKLNLLTLVMVVVCFGRTFAAETKPEARVSCECEASTCGPCEVDTGTTFYSAKCGVAMEQVKSCKKATCEPVENQKQCLALFKKNGAEPEAIASVTDSPDEKTHQLVAGNNAQEAGQIVEISGDVKVTHANGAAEKPGKRDPAYVGDTFETKADGRVKVLLRDGSEITMAPSSRVNIEKADVNIAAFKRQIALQVLSGKLRSKVHKEYKGDNFYQVKTKTAVAGVRGTDFITSFEPSATEWVSEIRTIEGLVKLQSSQPSLENGAPVGVEIPAGTYASVINDAPERGLAGDTSGSAKSEVDFLASKARVTPLFKIKEEDLKNLKESVEFLSSNAPVTAPSRSVASVAQDELCQAPTGHYNQCSYTCANNPKGESTCRTDIKDVSCVRKLCRANGQWDETKRLPASEGSQCEAQKTVVRDCENYW